jgi:hypothetical protein
MSCVVEYLSLACTGTGQATFYNSREEQVAALEALHGRMLAEQRETYGLSALLPINDRNRQLVLANLLAAPQGRVDPDLEWRVVMAIAEQLPFNRLLDGFLALEANNARVRRLGRWIWERADAYRVIKYREKLRRVLRHCHIAEGDDPAKAELHRWAFGRVRKASDVLHCELLDARLRAVHDPEALYTLPFDVARDLAVSQHKLDVKAFTEAYAERGRLTRKEGLRAAARADVAVDFRRYNLLELLQHRFRQPETAEGMADALEAAARKAAAGLRLPGKVALVVDNSASALGSGERLYQPIAAIEAAVRMYLAVPGTEVRVFTSGPAFAGVSGATVRDNAAPMPRDAALRAEGASDLATPLAAALAWRPRAIVILSDGYENAPAGGVARLLQLPVVRASGIAMVHLAPVVAAESGGVRRLAPELPSYGFAQPEQIALMAMLAAARHDPSVLTSFFDAVGRALKGGDVHVARALAGFRRLPGAVGGEHDGAAADQPGAGAAADRQPA